MMRRIATMLLLVIFSCALLSPGMAQDQPHPEGSSMKVLPKDELDVVKILVAQERAWNNGDMEGFLSGYKKSPETTFVGETVQHGWEEMAARYHATYPNREMMGTLSFSDLEPHLLDERFATVTGRYSLERSRKSGGHAQGIFSLVFEKTPQGWKILLDHTS